MTRIGSVPDTASVRSRLAEAATFLGMRTLNSSLPLNRVGVWAGRQLVSGFMSTLGPPLRGTRVVPVRDGAVVVPKVFFDETGHVVKSLQGLLVVLHDGGYQDTEIVRWLFTPDPSLTIRRDGSPTGQDNARPVDALHSHQAREVVRRAQAMAY